jgi:FtsH-binding integral membrane protein
MILTKSELFERTLPPECYDWDIAARTASLFCWVAAFWFFITPLTFYGVSAQSSAWNAWLVGGAMVLASMVRMIHPEHTTVFSMLNVVLSIWVLICPFVFGYVDDTPRLANTLSVGAVVLGSSLMSLRFTKAEDSTIETLSSR